LIYAFEGHINSSNPTTYLWNFGDGTTGTGLNVTHTFTQPPAGALGYNVCLTTVTSNSNSAVCSDTSCVFIPVSNTTNNCHANYSYYSDSATAANTIHFVNTSSTTYQNLQIVYVWNFGDGTTSSLQNPVHTFTSNPSTVSTYNVCLTIKVLNSAGAVECDNSICQTITIGTPAVSCQNSITFTHQNLIYAFEGHINSSNPTTYFWAFGDGTTATGKNVTHTFAQPSSTANGYHVCLTTVTSNNNGTSCSDTSCEFVSIIDTLGTVIQGYVYAGNYVVHDGYVLIYQANNATMSYSLIDTLALDSMGHFQYNYLNLPPVNPAFLIKAFINPTSALYNQYAPTFYMHSINWFTATPVFPSANTVFYYINMVPLPINPITGNGIFGGLVFMGGNKSSGDSPLSGVELILTDENDAALKINYSSSNGSFNFNNLPMGNYKLHVEIAGVNYTPYPFTLDDSNPNINNIRVIVNSTGAIITGIENELGNTSSISEIYPNPSTSEAFIDINNSKTDKIVVSIYDNTGIRLSADEYNVSGSKRINLNQKHFATGIYTVKIESTKGTSSVRKLVISN
ncbi:MAG: PKD domain-containing protein, partial [Bacteroidetes bacterium]|nr:PKD domain-containing protein [Bacteroidota bacterium]